MEDACPRGEGWGERGAGEPGRGPSSAGSSALADAVALGLPSLAEVLTRTEDGICVVDAERRYVYANPAACQMLGHPVEQLRGRDFLDSFPAREHATVLGRLPAQVGDTAAPFTCTLCGSDGAGREIDCSAFAIEMAGGLHVVAIFRDLAGPRAAARTAAALAQTAAQLVGAGTTEEILVGIARHAIEGTRALAVGIVVVGEDHKLAVSGGYGFPDAGRSRQAWTAGSITLDDLPGGDVLLVGEPVVLPDARSAWEASSVMAGFAATVEGMDWQGRVCAFVVGEPGVRPICGVATLGVGRAERGGARLLHRTRRSGGRSGDQYLVDLPSQRGSCVARTDPSGPRAA